MPIPLLAHSNLAKSCFNVNVLQFDNIAINVKYIQSYFYTSNFSMIFTLNELYEINNFKALLGCTL
jgi:hypothetical protein